MEARHAKLGGRGIKVFALNYIHEKIAEYSGSGSEIELTVY
jgi:hypothetical protein